MRINTFAKKLRVASICNYQYYFLLNGLFLLSEMHHSITFMYINFWQNRVSRSVKTCAQIYLQKMASCVNSLLPIIILKKSILLDMHHDNVHVYQISANELVDQSKPCTHIYLQMIASCINLQLPIVILKNSILLDIHHHKTYMYINFQQNRIN